MIIPHLLYAISQGYRYIVVASNDTDVVVLTLYCTHFYISKGLKKFWILYRTGDHKRYIPIQYLAKHVISIALSY